MKTASLLVVMMIAGVPATGAQEPRITRLAMDGLLTWSNPAAEGSSSVEQSTNLLGGWAALFSVPNTGDVVSALVPMAPRRAYYRVGYEAGTSAPSPVVVVYVALGAAGTQDGTSWFNAFTNIQDGITAAATSNQVWIKAGVHSMAGGPVALKPGLELYGGFAGSESALEQRDAVANHTVVQGNGGLGFLGAHGARLDGFTLTGFQGGDGNVLSANQTAPSAYHCVVSNNAGGAPFFFSQLGDQSTGESAVVDCTFADNAGGAIRYWGRTNEGRVGPHILTVDRCTFRNNRRDSTGGAIDADYSGDWLRLYNSVFEGNTALDGGAVYLRNGLNSYTPIDHCTFVDNVASNAGNSVYVAHHFTDGTPGLVEILNTIIRGSESNAVYLAGHRDFPSDARLGFSDLENGLASVRLASATVAGVTDLGGLISGDPLFAAAGNYHLQSGSPCIDAGTNSPLTELAVDRDGLSRPVGTAPDMGAYESRP